MLRAIIFFMEKMLQENFLKCECGKKHFSETQKIEVSSCAFSFVADFLKEKNIKKILLFCENDCFFEKQICESGIVVKVVKIPNCIATEYLAKSLKEEDGEIVVAFGKEELVSVAKYYASMWQKQLVVCAIDNFADFTFSSFARLYDGVQFCFYKTVCPLAIFVQTSEKANKFQTFYLSTKFLLLFDNEFSRLVYKENDCERMKDFLKKTMCFYVSKNNKMQLAKRNAWTLVRLGMAMTFYGETRFFFGGDKVVCDMLQSMNIGADFLELETIAFKLAFNCYACFIKNSQTYHVANLNLQIKHASKLLGVPQTEIIKRLGKNEVLMPDEKTRTTFFNFQPYLKNYFDKMVSEIFKIQTTFCICENVLLKNDLCGEKVKNALSVCASFSKRPTLLSFIFAFGFMDKLFE